MWLMSANPHPSAIAFKGVEVVRSCSATALIRYLNPNSEYSIPMALEKSRPKTFRFMPHACAANRVVTLFFDSKTI